MSIETHVRRVGTELKPIDESSLMDLMKLDSDKVYKCTIVKPRNLKFHRKFFALLKFAFEHWDVDEVETKWGWVQKNFDQFREDIIIQCGHYEQVFRTDGSFRIIAKSIRFANMPEGEFAELYKSASQVILSKILTQYTKDDLDRVVEEVLRFG